MLKCTFHKCVSVIARVRSVMEAFKSEWIIMSNLQRWRFNFLKASNDNKRTSQKHKEHELGANEDVRMKAA